MKAWWRSFVPDVSLRARSTAWETCAAVRSAMPAREVGRVASLWRYPVKSMASESLEETEVSWHGLRGDRRWAFVRDGVSLSGFPWLTMREKPLMAHYRPFFLEPTKPD